MSCCRVVAVDFDKAGQKQHAPHDGLRPCDLMTCTAVAEYAEYTAHWRVQQGSSKVASEGVANKMKLSNPPNHHIHLKSTCLLRKFIALPFFTLFCAIFSEEFRSATACALAPLRPCPRPSLYCAFEHPLTSEDSPGRVL